MFKFLLAAVTIASVAAEGCSTDLSCTDAIEMEGTDPTKTMCRVPDSGCVACIGASGCTGTDLCSVKYTCVAKGVDDATCAAIDAAKPKWSTVSNKCLAAATDDATCVAIDAAKSKWLGCVDGSTSDIELAKMCGEGTTYDKAKKKCVTDPTSDIELAKMCGEGTMYDKAKKKCVTNPTSRCTPGLTNTTTDKSAAADESAGSSRFVSHTATL